MTDMSLGMPHKLLTLLDESAAEIGALPSAVNAHVVIDIGNSETYAVVMVEGRKAQMVRFPSIKSVYGASARHLLADRGAPGNWSALSADEHVVTTDDLDTFVGMLAHRAGHANSTSGSEMRYADGWNLDLLFAAVGALTVGAEKVNARIVSGMPFGLWTNHHVEAESVLKRTHTFTYNGQPKKLHVVKADMEREGYSAWFALPEERRKGLCLILDWGGYTCNIVLVTADGQIIRGFTAPIGVNTILDDISAATPRALSLKERGELLVALKEQRGYELVVQRQRVAIEEIAKKVFRRAAINFHQKLWAMIPVEQRSEIETFAYVGGAAYFMGTALQERIPGLYIPKEPELMNLYGNAVKHGLGGAKPTGRRGK